ARSRPVQRRFLSLFPSFVEPTLNQQTKLKLSVYQAEARFGLPRPAAALDLSRYANIALLEQIDPAVKHRPITAGDAVPNKDAGAAHNRPPDRRWCEDAKAICVQSRYMFEGKIPAGIQLANKLREESKKPILRNLVPAQLLMGNSSFNSGDSLSAGLPKYARSRIKAIADMMERE